MEKAPPILLQGEVSAGGTVTQEHKFDTGGVVNRLYSVAYAGEEADVERRAVLLKGGKDTGHAVNLLTPADSGDTASDPFLAGENQTWDFSMRREFEAGDILQVKWTNKDGTNAYPVQAVVGVDHAGAGLFEALTQVF